MSDEMTMYVMILIRMNIDVSPRHGLGGLKTDSMLDAKRPVTSGDIMRMFASA